LERRVVTKLWFAYCQQQVAQRRSKLHQSRIEQEALITPKVIPLPLPIVEAMPVSSVTKQFDFPNPPKDNPWRKFKFGRSLYQKWNLRKIELHPIFS
jgi:hypothetical protein